MANQFRDSTFSSILDLEKRQYLSSQNDNLESSPALSKSKIPPYATFQHLVSIGNYGLGPVELRYPLDVSIQEDTGNIFVSDYENRCILIFSESGDYIKTFKTKHLLGHRGILIHEDNIYVTDCIQNAIFKFYLPDFRMIKRKGKRGSGFEEFDSLSQLAMSPCQRIYVTDTNNHRIQTLSRYLIFQGSLRHKSMSFPVDIKFSTKQLFVLSSEDNPCIHIFTLLGKKIRSIITRGEGLQVVDTFFFCLDASNNFIISDYTTDSVKVFSPDGDLLHVIGEAGYKPGMFYCPKGIAILNQTKLVCASLNRYSYIHIFSP